MLRYELGSFNSTCYQEVSSWEYGIGGPSGFIKDGKFLNDLSDCQLLKNGSAQWSYLIFLFNYVDVDIY